MENIQQKADFLKKEFTELLRQIDADTPQKWGLMNVQQMIEHMSYSMRIASGRLPVEIVTADEYMPRMQAFLESEKPFRENTPNALLPNNPQEVTQPDKEAAIVELQQEIDYFFSVYEQDKAKSLKNPFFGVLDFEHQIQLLHKHSLHHLRQFGVEV